MQKPQPGDYHPFYQTYVDKVPEGNIIEILERQYEEMKRLLAEIPAEKREFRYAENKWSIQEVLGHLIDTERILSWRALAISRNEQQPLPGFDENDYVVAAEFDSREWEDLVEEFLLVRQSSIALFRGFSKSMWQRLGVANNANVRVIAFPYIIAGHEKHHRMILDERYL